MSWSRVAAKEFVGLFLDDGSLAVAVLVWAGLAVLLFPSVPLPAPWLAILLFAGLGAILVENALRAAGRRNR